MGRLGRPVSFLGARLAAGACPEAAARRSARAAERRCSHQAPGNSNMRDTPACKCSPAEIGRESQVPAGQGTARSRQRCQTHAAIPQERSCPAADSQASRRAQRTLAAVCCAGLGVDAPPLDVLARPRLLALLSPCARLLALPLLLARSRLPLPGLLLLVGCRCLVCLIRCCCNRRRRGGRGSRRRRGGRLGGSCRILLQLHVLAVHLEAAAGQGGGCEQATAGRGGGGASGWRPQRPPETPLAAQSNWLACSHHTLSLAGHPWQPPAACSHLHRTWQPVWAQPC